MPTGETFDARVAAVAEDLDKLIRRLRTLSPRALHDRRPAIQDALAELARLGARLEGKSIEPPSVADHVLADAIAVVGWDIIDVVTSRADETALGAVDSVIEAALASTR